MVNGYIIYYLEHGIKNNLERENTMDKQFNFNLSKNILRLSIDELNEYLGEIETQIQETYKQLIKIEKELHIFIKNKKQYSNKIQYRIATVVYTTIELNQLDSIRYEVKNQIKNKIREDNQLAKTIKGYSKLSNNAKIIFIKIYKRHQRILSESEKSNWKAVEVSEIEDYIRVDFFNGKWLHYKAIGRWY